jgi:hypothetical protein
MQRKSTHPSPPRVVAQLFLIEVDTESGPDGGFWARERSIFGRAASRCPFSESAIPCDGKEIMRSNNTRRLERNRKFVDSPLEGTGFEPSVPLFAKGVSRLLPAGPISWTRVIKHRSSRETTMVGRGPLLHAVSFTAGPMVRIHLPPAASPSLSPELLSRVENPGFPRGCAPLAWRPGRQRRAGCFKMAPTGGNISVAPYSNTAVPLMGSARMPRRSQ